MAETISDFNMPEKVVTRLLRDALPDNVVISKDAKNAACRSASIFILHLSIAAAEKAQTNKRRTLENQDIIKAVQDLGLGEYCPQLVRFGAQRKRNAKRRESNNHKSKSGKKPQEIPDDMEPNQETPDQCESDNQMIDFAQEPQFQDEEDSQMADE